MSGLASAIILAKEGRRVLVLEQHYRAGGLMHRFFRRQGAQFDVGFHYLGSIGPDEVLGSYFRYLGILDRIAFIPLDVEGYDELRFPEFSFLIPAGRERYQDRLCAVFPQERRAIETYFRDLATICDDFPLYRLQTAQDLAHLDRWMSTPLEQYLTGLTNDLRLQAVLKAQSFLYGVDSRRAPLALHALVVDSFMQSPSAIRGGGDALAQAMVARLVELGGEVRLRQRVEQIVVDDARGVKAVRTQAGELIETRMVVSSAHPKATVRMLAEGTLRPGYRRRVLGLEDGISTLQVFATTDADLSRYAGRNIYHFKTEDIDSLYVDVGRPHRFAFVTAPTAREGVTSAGKHQAIGLGLMDWPAVSAWQDTQTGKRGSAYEAFKAAQTAELLALMAEAMPELKGAVESAEAATPLTCRDYTGSEKGAAYGIHHTTEQSGRYGLLPRTRVGGLFLTGQSVLMPGICGTAISAFQTCSAILGSEHLLGRVHETL